MTVRPMPELERAAYREFFGHVYLGPNAAALAVAMHERTGWPTWAIIGGDGKPLHAGVRDPDGRFRDVRGSHDLQGFCQDIDGVLREVPPGDLVALPPHEREFLIGRARKDVGLLVDDLPGTDPWLARLEAFAAGLEKLCLDTGIYVREDTHGGIPVYEAYGDEKGFAIGFDETGGARLSRRLR